MPLTDGLDSGPPLPPGMTSARPPSLNVMAGGGAAGGASSSPSDGQGAASLQQSVIQDFMLIEKTLQSITSKVPSFGPIADGMVQQLRAQGAKVISTLGQPPAAPATPMQSIMQSVGAAPQM